MKTPAGFPLVVRRAHHALAWLGATTLCLGLPSLRADEWSPNPTLTTNWQDNPTNANLSSDRIGARRTQAELLASQCYPLSGDDSAQFGSHAAADW